MSKKKREIKEVDKDKKEIDKEKKSCVCSGNSLKWIFLFIVGVAVGFLINHLIGLMNQQPKPKEVEYPKEIIDQQPREAEYPKEVEYRAEREIANELEVFVEEFLINEGQILDLTRTEKVNGLIRIYFELDGRELILYTTKDGAFLIFEQGLINLDEHRAEVEWQRKSDQFQVDLTPERKVKIAQCLTERGFRVYVADWCPFCRQQKELFGKAAKYLTSIDCFDPDGPKGNIAKCPHIRGVPAWEDGEGNMLPYEGMLSIKRLVELSGCAF